MKEIPVLFENDFCMVLDKPPGLPVQGGKGIKISLDSILSEKYSPRPLLVHRLDRDTSGIILVAKTKEAAAGFSVLFSGKDVDLSAFHQDERRVTGTYNHSAKQGKGRTVISRYVGVCFGIPEKRNGVIRLGLDIRGKGRTKVQKEAETYYKVLSSDTYDYIGELSFSLLELELGTGRMHQIRRHLAQTGFPLLGDDKYGNFSLNRELRKKTGVKQLLLHASRLIIPPSPGFIPEGLDISSPLPVYFSLEKK